jgi:hypothetical protein
MKLRLWLAQEALLMIDYCREALRALNIGLDLAFYYFIYVL